MALRGGSSSHICLTVVPPSEGHITTIFLANCQSNFNIFGSLKAQVSQNVRPICRSEEMLKHTRTGRFTDTHLHGHAPTRTRTHTDTHLPGHETTSIQTYTCMDGHKPKWSEATRAWTYTDKKLNRHTLTRT